PMAISSAATPSIQRSTVHHHMPSAERSERAKAWAWEELMRTLSPAWGATARRRRAGAPSPSRGPLRLGLAGQALHRGAEVFAALLEIGVRVEGGAGRREQDDGVLAGVLRVGEGGGDGGLHGGAVERRRLAVQRAGEGRRGLADQIGLLHAPEEVA